MSYAYVIFWDGLFRKWTSLGLGTAYAILDA